MNRRDFLKVFGLSVASTLLSTGAINAVELDAPITEESPLAYVTIDGARYSLVSFAMNMTTSLDTGMEISATIEFEGMPSPYAIMSKGYVDFSLNVPGVNASFVGRMSSPSCDTKTYYKRAAWDAYTSERLMETTEISGTVEDGLTVNITL